MIKHVHVNQDTRIPCTMRGFPPMDVSDGDNLAYMGRAVIVTGDGEDDRQEGVKVTLVAWDGRQYAALLLPCDLHYHTSSGERVRLV
jgi:hypothetical protein